MSEKLNKILTIIHTREALMNDVPDEFISAISGIQENIYRDLQGFVKELDVKANKLDPTTFNLSMADRLRSDIRRWLKKYGYYENITSFGRQYQKLADEAAKYFSALGLDDTFSKRDLETLSKIKKDDLNFMRRRDADVINTTYNQVINSIYGKNDWRDLDKALKAMHTDAKQARGLLKKYTGTYANTAFAAFDRQIMNIKSNELGLEWFYFSGSSIKDSREFCNSRINKAFTRDQVNGWQQQKWKGKKTGGSVWVYLGGYNCQHSLSPVTEALANEINNGE